MEREVARAEDDAAALGHGDESGRRVRAVPEPVAEVVRGRGVEEIGKAIVGERAPDGGPARTARLADERPGLVAAVVEANAARADGYIAPPASQEKFSLTQEVASPILRLADTETVSIIFRIDI